MAVPKVNCPDSARLVKVYRTCPPFFTGGRGGTALPPVKPLVLFEMRLPMITFKLRIEMFFQREPHAKIGDELPLRGNIESAANLPRVEDRHPADAKIFRTRAKPKSMDRRDH